MESLALFFSNLFNYSLLYLFKEYSILYREQKYTIFKIKMWGLESASKNYYSNILKTFK